MELLVNDLSLHRQFHDTSSFRDALARLMAMREVAQRFGRELHCYRAMLWAEAIPGVPMQKALSRLTESERRSATLWFTHRGPFWDDLRQHGANDCLEYRGEIVTESAVGEAAYKSLHDVECGLASFTPSDWSFSPIEVTWRYRAGGGLIRMQCLTIGRMPVHWSVDWWMLHHHSDRGTTCEMHR